MLSAIQIGKALQHATFPIRNIEELLFALQFPLKGEERCEESKMSRVECLLSPRDFLFTNAGQVRRVLEARQGALASGETQCTERVERTERRD